VKCESIFKISEGRPNPSDYLKNGEITMMMITSSGDEPDLRDGKDLRRLALTLQVCAVCSFLFDKKQHPDLAFQKCVCTHACMNIVQACW
jgi:hypothetical protein